MRLTTDFLNYPALLAGPDRDAFISAMTTSHGSNFGNLLTQFNADLGVPACPPNQPATETALPLVPLTISPAPPGPPLAPLATVLYTRLDFGHYMECCQRYLSNGEATDAASVADWLMREHRLWFDPTKLTLSAITPDPDEPDRSLLTVSVAATNYVWIGSVTLYVVASNHLALLAKPGVSTGIRPSDVGLSGSDSSA